MEPMQALENLNQAVGLLQLTRQQHLILAKSVEVIRERLAKVGPAKEDPMVECGMKAPGLDQVEAEA